MPLTFPTVTAFIVLLCFTGLSLELSIVLFIYELNLLLI